MSRNSFFNIPPLGGLPYYRSQRQHPREPFLRQLSEILWQDSERNSSLENELRDLKTINGGLQFDIQSKDDALAKWRAHDSSVSKQLKEYEQLAEDLARDKEDLLKKLESQPSETQRVQEQNERLNGQLSDAYETVKTLKESHSQQENDSRTKIKDLEDEAARRKSTLFKLRSELEELGDEHTELQSSRDSFARDYEKLDRDMVTLREELDGEKQSNQALRTDAVAGAKQLQEGSATLEMVRKEVAHLFSSLQPCLEDITQLNSIPNDERSSNANLETELIAIKNAVISMLRANQGLKNELEASNSDKAQVQADIASADKRCVELEGQNRSLNSRTSSLQSELQRAQDKISKIEDERGRIDRELSVKKRTLKSMCQKFDVLNEESQKLGEDNTASTSKLSEQSKTIKQLQGQLSQCKRENEDLHSLQKKSKDDSRAKQNLADAFESRVKYLEDQIDELKSDLKRKEEEMSAAREFIQQQHAARDKYIRATDTPSPFQPAPALARSSQAHCKDVPMGPLEQTSPSKSLPSSKLPSSPTSPLGNQVAATPRKFSNATEEGETKVSPAASIVGDAQHDNTGKNSRLESRDPRLNRIKFSLSPQKRGIESVQQNKNQQNPKNPKKSRSM
ncbi:hypothetical protein KC367_g301 [Hortaea werneckii]|nr:hypothetical protein KC342_g8607 [Hortaea werneckii]KAI7106560.1 hypothetical protein KC339_g3032 [Hortaea werneckii]KAI7245242.1 hypothetical protein KC365_g655 [Hortaea werneckii]KAI7339323.1 hypothetical protein KC340_g654 [Hortaea werneckii]KAI7399069.1 hypothetical protein KC328_g4174 [Hortaea werneckii]